MNVVIDPAPSSPTTTPIDTQSESVSADTTCLAIDDVILDRDTQSNPHQDQDLNADSSSFELVILYLLLFV